MKNFIEVKGEDNTSALVNVSQIAAIDFSSDGIVIHMVGGYDVLPQENELQLKHLIEESYLE